jgi:hypothetical protein
MNLKSPTGNSPFRARVWSILVFAVVLTTGLSVMTSNCADPDLWGHVQYGREVLNDGVLPRTATWTYAAEGAPWVNHENIAELLLAWTVDSFGADALPWMKLCIAGILMSLMIVSARCAGAGWMAIFVVIILVAANVQFHWHYRPQILTYLSLAAMLAVWQSAFQNFRPDEEDSIDASKHRLKLLWLLPFILCFWANSHGGFAAGIAIFCAHHGLTFVQVVKNTGLKHSRFLIQLSLVTIISVLATLVNPYGLGLWKFMLAALKLPRPEIADWGPLSLWDQEAIRFWSLLTVSLLSLMSLIANRRRPNVTQLFIMALLLWQGMSHCRHLSIFAIVCGFWIPSNLQTMIDDFTTSLRKLHADRPAKQAGAFAMAMLIGVILLNGIRLAPLLREVPVERSEFPVTAMQYLHDQRLHGKILVTFNWAQYAIGCFAADAGPLRHSRVAVDGRFETCYPREITDVCFDFWLGTADPSRRYRSPAAPPFDPSAALSLGQPDLVLLSRRQLPSVRMMQQHADEWTLLYQDSLAQIWGRSVRYADPAQHDYVHPEDRLVTNDQQTGSVPWPAFPKHTTPSLHLTLR